MMAAEPVNAAHPLRAAAAALLVHPRTDAVCQMIMVCFFAYWASLILVWPQATPRDAGALRPLALAAMAIMWRVTTVYLGGLQRARQVLGGRQTPTPLWLQLTRVAAWRIGAVWALLCAAMPVAFLWTGTGMQALYGAALISLTASMAAASKLARTDGARTSLASLLFVAWAAVFGWLAVDGARFALLGAAAPALALLACTLTFPLALMLVVRRTMRTCASALPSQRWNPGTPRQSWLRHCLLQTRRFTMVASKPPPVDPDAPPMPPAAKVVIVILANLYPMWALLQLARPVWHQGRLDLTRLLLLIAVGFIMIGALIARDVGWRSFLMPGGLQRGRIGSHICRWTMACQFAILAGLAMVFAALAHFGMQRGWDSIGGTLLGFGLVPLELMFACSLAVLLRGLPYAVKLWPGLAGVALGVAAMIFAMSRAPVLTVGVPLAWYAGALCVASAGLVMLADRIWKPARLLPESAR